MKVLDANAIDLREAARAQMSGPLYDRLKLGADKLQSLISGTLPVPLEISFNGLGLGIRQIADAPDPIGRVLARTELAEGLVLQKETTSLGVLLVIFEVKIICNTTR